MTVWPCFSRHTSVNAVLYQCGWAFIILMRVNGPARHPCARYGLAALNEQPYQVLDR
jgi:hypothetical protein